MRNNLRTALSAAVLFAALLSPALALAESSDPGLDLASPFKMRAEAMDALAQAKIKALLARINGDDGAGGSHHRAVQRPPILTEIGGSGGHLVAVFTYDDGTTETARPHDRVSGIGTVTAITLKGVQDDRGRWHALDSEEP